MKRQIQGAPYKENAQSVVATDENYTIDNLVDVVDVTGTATITLPPKPYVGQSHRIAAVGGDATVVSGSFPIVGTTTVPKGTSLDFTFSSLNQWVSSDRRGSPALAVTTLDIDWSLANIFTKTLAAGANAITFSNTADGVIIVILIGAASTVTWPAGVKWGGGAAPMQTASGRDVYTFVKAGADIYGSAVQAMA